MLNMKRLSGLFSNPKTAFQILSDLYLHNDSQYLTFHIPPTAPYLVLAGNIGRLIDYEAYLSFLIRRCNLYERVFLVLGALEFSGISIASGRELAAKLQAEDRLKGKLVVLDRRRFEIPGSNVTILGCTLWSEIPRSAEAAVVKKVPEFDSRTGIMQWSCAEHNAAHATDLVWLKQEVQAGSTFAGSNASSSGSPSNFLVVTSFTPSLREALAPWQVDSPWSSAYGTELLSGHDWNGVRKWVCGSTGRTVEFKQYGVKVVTNERGCVGEEVTGVLGDGLNEKERRGIFDVTRVVRV